MSKAACAKLLLCSGEEINNAQMASRCEVALDAIDETASSAAREKIISMTDKIIQIQKERAAFVLSLVDNQSNDIAQ